MIHVTVVGTLGQDAELKTFGGGPMLSLRLASSRWDAKTKAKGTDWVNVAIWGQRVERLAPMLTKGSRIAVRGELSVREYEAKGEKRTALEVRADDVELLDGRRGGDDAPF